jgi:tetratricopeptide (TPR) repeat protein
MVRSLAKLALTGAFVCGLAAWPLAGQAQQQQQQQPAPQQAAPAGQQPPLAPPKLNPKEEADFKQILSMKAANVDTLIEKGETFVKDYPDSRYLPTVYAKLADAYATKGNAPKMFADAEKAVELNPDEVEALSLLANMLPRRIDLNAPGAEAQLAKAEQYANHAIQLLNTLQKPAGVTDEQFARTKNELLASCHSGLGLTSYYRQNVPKAITEFELATQLGQDPVDYFLLGVMYDAASRYSDAVGAFTHCSSAPGPMQARCQAKLEDAKKKAAAPPAK